ncbi:MAG: hypothetical protein DWQ36_04325 [Acidobacteria bacterium]|nr:MAG: hypothetical protein DWQ30_09175 [Acidobacteriota bacterium]REK10388.1 MAG: hypothetical protein DWQ36_04325 [Acidobacteriota bacterium]
MLSKLLVVLIALILIWMAIRSQIAGLLERPDVQAARRLADEMRRRRSTAARDGDDVDAGDARPRRVELLAVCTQCGVHTPRQRLVEGPGGRLLCGRCRVAT